MRKQKAWLSLLLAAALAVSPVPFSAASAGGTGLTAVEAAAKTAITNVDTGTLTLTQGETFQLKASPSNVTWKSSNKKIVTVSKSGKLKGIQNGTATVTAGSGKTQASVEVTVGTKVGSVNVYKPAVALAVGGQSTIKAEVAPADASNQALTYKSADTGVAKVTKKGVITGKGAGRTKITVTAADGSKKKETVTVTVRAAGTPVRLQDDFYQAVNATVLQENALQENESQWSGFDDLQDNITKDLSGLIDGLAAEKDQYEDGTIEQKIIDIYQLARDMDARDQAGVEPLKAFTDQIDGAQTVEEFVDVLTQMARSGVQTVFLFSIMQDLEDSSRNVLLNQGPVYVLPKDYMIGEANQPVQQAVLAFIEQMFVLAGESGEQAAGISNQVFSFIQELAAGGVSLAEQYDMEKSYHSYTKDELVNLYSNCDIDSYLKAMGITDFDKCMVYEEDNVKKLNSYLVPEHLDLLKNYAKFILYMSSCSYLTSAHAKALNDLNTVITGPAEDKSTDETAKELTQGLFAWEFGRLYVENYFSEDSKKEIEGMTRDLINTFRARIQRLDWLSDATKAEAVKKLDAMTVKIGYPDKWPSYFDDVPVDGSKGLMENILNIQAATYTDMQKQLDEGVDKDQWVMTPQTVNACYNPQVNDITFPAAILQAPFYDKNADYAQNLGGIGTVIGHEITHAFDTNGALYDENGNYKSWWTEADMAEFSARAERVKKYYSSIEVANGLFQNGDQTITENIADMGAMACALEIAGNDKKAQLQIFSSNANIWASNQTDQWRNYLLTVDVHSLNKVRVNAILPLFDQFYDVFGVTENDAMYVAPEDRVQIW